MKKLFKVLAITMVLLITATTICSCNTAIKSAADTCTDTNAPAVTTEGADETVNNTASPSAQALTYVSLRINPEIELIVDENTEVIAVNPINEDGEVVLADTELTGMTVAEAGEAFTDKAAELGYLDVDSTDATVYIEAERENT